MREPYARPFVPEAEPFGYFLSIASSPETFAGRICS
jgi:hypothetical protein